MKRPFDYINGHDKIDVNNPAHQKVVIQRDKKLKKAVEEGIYLDEFKVWIKYEFQCPSCGNTIYDDEFVDDSYDEIINVLPDTINCKCCDANFYLQTYFQKYTCVIPKTVLK